MKSPSHNQATTVVNHKGARSRRHELETEHSPRGYEWVKVSAGWLYG